MIVLTAELAAMPIRAAAALRGSLDQLCAYPISVRPRHNTGIAMQLS
ncbi:hypothetical protein AB0B57_18145 [Micromonospora sp. NPDC049101]